MEILLQIVWFTGWVLGIIGFFSARAAHAELRRLRVTLAQPGAAAARAEPDQPEPAPNPPEPIQAAAQPPADDLETRLTTNWGIWVGSAALLLAGVFLIRYAVEQELLGPATRCALASLLGAALLAGAEFLHRHDIPSPLAIDQAPAGLAAGGTALLFGAAYGAGPFYALLPPLAAFIAMAAASLIALAAALRYGPLTAATGIAGAFVTPALVATQDPSLPGLFAYLLIVSAAALLVVRRTNWRWLAHATAAAGAIWVCYAGLTLPQNAWPAAVFIPASAALAVWLAPSFLDFAAIGLAGLVMEVFTPGLMVQTALLLLSPIAVARGTAGGPSERLPWLAGLIGLLTLLIWRLPATIPRGTPLLPDPLFLALANPPVPPLLTAAALLAAFHAAAGLWQQRRSPNGPIWAALPAAVPVLALAISYARIEHFAPNPIWAAAALALAVGLTTTTAAAADRKAAGVHAAGAVAALALGAAMLLADQWLTLAIALFLPPLALIEARTDLTALRPVATAVAALVIVRATLNWYVLDYGTAAALIPADALPAASFALSSHLFRRRSDDRTVATLETGAIALLALFIALEIRRLTGTGSFGHNPSFTEAALHLLTLAIQATAYLFLAQRTRRPMLVWAWQILGLLALALAAALLLFNPILTNAEAGIATLLAAYLIPAALAVAARRAAPTARLRTALGAYAVTAAFAWITLQIRELFHPAASGFYAAPVEAAELWAWSGAWLGYGIALMIQAIRTHQRTLRLTALGVIGLVCLKVFSIDMSGLTGLWRVLSFLGLGLALIGLGTVYRRFVLSPDPHA